MRASCLPAVKTLETFEFPFPPSIKREQIESVASSAPHIHRGQVLRVKLTEHHVEIFHGLERLAIHSRSRHRDGRRIKIDAQFPPASQAYCEATPRQLFSQAGFIGPALHRLVVDLLDTGVYGNIRRVQGTDPNGSQRAADPRIRAAECAHRVGHRPDAPLPQDPCPILERIACAATSTKARHRDAARQLVRLPGNPMLRYVRGGLATDPDVHPKTVE